ncbi:hypothetical protein OG21DRAFT_958221 [Imleria badia]|nr:hypothetical protein OG21DRAFT_958221 [Imleria badia]
MSVRKGVGYGEHVEHAPIAQLELNTHLMSDQSPPPKPKPGSLRDRIAAFENKGAPGAPAVPPPPRPKPGGLQWKPKPPSPPPTSPDDVQSADRKPASTAGMSASDAMESIGRAGSLKERMAALQGKGAFGGPPPPIAPKPNVDRPKWKPPPAVPASATSDDEDASGRAPSKTPPPRAMSSPPPPENQGAPHRDADAVPREGDGGDPDPEEEERQRRAAIAARMARLGGARFGMSPPIFAPKPVVRKPEPAPEVKDEAHGDQPTIVKESSEALVTSTSPPDDLPAAVPHIPKVVTETEHKDEHESPPPVPTRAPTAMPVPAGPRRAGPPRKKASRNAPATALPEPPVEEEDGMIIHAPHITNELPASADRTIHDARDSQKEIDQVTEVVGATHDEHLNITAEAEQRTPAPVEAFRKPVEEPEKQEAEEELVEGTASHVEEHSMHTAADDQEAPFEQPPEVFEADEEEEETRRQRVAAKLAQMGAFNPLVAPPITSHQSFDEPAFVPSEAPLDVEDEVNVDTEEYGVTIPPPPAVPPRQHTVQTIEHDAAEPHVAADQDDVKVDEDDRVPAHRDGES